MNHLSLIQLAKFSRWAYHSPYQCFFPLHWRAISWQSCVLTNWCNVQDYVPEDIESISGFEPPQSPDSSYNNLHLVSEDYAKEPPVVPPHLQMTLLNVSPSHMEIPPPLSRPQHVVLNHLYMQKDRSTPSVVALGSTNRFLSKYVTVVLYKSIQRWRFRSTCLYNSLK